MVVTVCACCCKSSCSLLSYTVHSRCTGLLTSSSYCCLQQVTEATSPSGNASMSVRLQPPSATQATPSPSQQPEASSRHGQHCTHTSAGALSDTQPPRGNTAKNGLDSPSRHGVAARTHAGHAGLLRFKRQWPVPKPLMLSDSDDSDSLSDFDSIADFHIEAAAGGKLAHQQDARQTAVKAGSTAVCRSSAGPEGTMVNSGKAIGTGQSRGQQLMVMRPCRARTALERQACCVHTSRPPRVESCTCPDCFHSCCSSSC